MSPEVLVWTAARNPESHYQTSHSVAWIGTILLSDQIFLSHRLLQSGGIVYINIALSISQI